MATLSNPILQVDILTGSQMVTVTTTVDVTLSPFDMSLIANGLGLELRSRVWGEDSGFNGGDDNLFLLPTQTVTTGGTYTFSRSVPRAWLDEDNGNDEIYNRFTLRSRSNIFPFNTSIRTPTLTGEFS
jgi:hypothetical protein